ncbi:MAG: hypothetical protein ABL927_09115 [Bdellovibrionales bacterium]
MKYLNKRSIKLTNQEISEFITDHLPYRIKVLEILESYPYKINSDPLWPSVYESAQITSRMFIQFMGFGVEIDIKGIPHLKESRNYYSADKINSYEVKIIDLGFEFISLSELKDEKQMLLAHAYESGNKATAHLTYKSPFEPNPKKVIQASKIIREILKNKLSI